ncbi:Aminoacyltransferase FemB [[Eubacterium] infirmum]|nr:Aminoacyltransferase FemB [[Eubacterium] infirmum]
MSIEIKPITIKEFASRQLDFDCMNFQQSAEMALCQSARAVYLDTETVQILKDGQFIGQSIINYRSIFRFFREACILNGPLLDYSAMSKEELKDVFYALQKYLRMKCDEIRINPPLVHFVLDEKLETVETLNENVKSAFDELSFKNYVDRNCSESIDQIFVKSLKNYSSFDEISGELSSSFRSSIKKFSESCVKVREMGENELGDYYKIYSDTAERKHFPLQTEEYYVLLKKNFGDKAKIMGAFLDCREYENYLSSNISMFENKIAELELSKQSKKIKGQLNDAHDRLRSFIKRKDDYHKLGISEDIILLSSYVLVCYGKEVIIMSGGSEEKYLNFGGSTLINWEMIRYAFENGYERYNFHGTIETDQITKAKGNYHFKKNFGGNLQILLGSFIKNVNPILSLIKCIRRVH